MHTHKTHKTNSTTFRILTAIAVAVFALVFASGASARKHNSTPTTPVAPAPTLISTSSNTRYVSASQGSDSNSGTETAPWRTLAKAASSATSGTTVVLEPGTYGGYGVTTNVSNSGTSSAPIVFTSAAGREEAVVRGYVRVTASYVHLDSLVFDGPTGPVVSKSSSNPGGEEVEVSFMGGTGVELSRSEVRESAWHAGVFVSKVTGARLVSNYVHNNGDAATGANLDHGIYWCSGTGTISNNVVENNVAWGIQLYPTTTNVMVSHNTVKGNGRGGIIVSRESAGDQLLNNLVANNAEYGIRAYELSGTGNVARENLLWNNVHNTYGSGLSFSQNTVADPKTLSPSALAAFGATL
jgi:parallel beta-helix repeat protein